MKICFPKLSLLFLLISLTVGLSSFNTVSSDFQNSILDIEITNIRGRGGNFILGFYKDSKSFKKRQPFMWKKVAKSAIVEGKLTFKIPMPPGTYGIALLDDENDNGKVDFSFLLPSEGFGFSDYVQRGLSIPTFKDFDFQHICVDKKVLIKVKYI